MQKLNRLEEVIIAILMLISAVLVFINVFLRQLSMGMPWTEELIRYMIIWITFLGMSACVREGSHISIEAIPDLMKGTAKKWLQAAIYFFCIVFSLAMTWYSFQYLSKMSSTGQLSPALGVPMYYFYIVILISSFMIVFRYANKFIGVFKPAPASET